MVTLIDLSTKAKFTKMCCLSGRELQTLYRHKSKTYAEKRDRKILLIVHAEVWRYLRRGRRRAARVCDSCLTQEFGWGKGTAALFHPPHVLAQLHQGSPPWGLHNPMSRNRCVPYTTIAHTHTHISRETKAISEWSTGAVAAALLDVKLRLLSQSPPDRHRWSCDAPRQPCFWCVPSPTCAKHFWRATTLSLVLNERLPNITVRNVTEMNGFSTAWEKQQKKNFLQPVRVAAMWKIRPS